MEAFFLLFEVSTPPVLHPPKTKKAKFATVETQNVPGVGQITWNWCGIILAVLEGLHGTALMDRKVGIV